MVLKLGVNRRAWARTLVRSVIYSALCCVVGCTNLTGGNNDDEFPAGVPDPATLDNSAGALAMYRNALVTLFGGGLGAGVVGAEVVKNAIETGGVFGDELQTASVGAVTASLIAVGGDVVVDARTTGSAKSLLYRDLQRGRGDIRLAAAALHRHGAETWSALRGLMFALEGYTEILLADLYCSGVPLSTVDFRGDYTYQPGSTTQGVYEHALTLFDSALALSADSAQVLRLAGVWKARTLLNLGRFTEAARIAASVPDGFSYQVKLRWVGKGSSGLWTTTVGDREGVNGLPFRTSGDPRTAVVQNGTNATTREPLWVPQKYRTSAGVSLTTLGDAVEARLIEAEAALHQEDVSAWLEHLNRLRTDRTFTVRPNPGNPARMDTLWNAGTGGVAGLAPLQDPGVLVDASIRKDVRVDLLFTERAAWMFLTGHRVGDLRRLVRAVSDGGYGRDEERVWPTGTYRGGPLLNEYGRDVTLVIPETERRNPYFTGCQGRGA